MGKEKLILLVNGPNLNLLGGRETGIYGKETLEEINAKLMALAKNDGVTLDIFQSNSEGAIIDFIQSRRKADGMVINPGAFTHTSIAIRDAISATSIPTVEVHLSNIYAREEFRSCSFIAPVSLGQISGFGSNSYVLGYHALMDYLSKK